MFWQLAYEVLGQVHGAAPRSHLLPFALCALVLAPLAAFVARRATRSWVASVLGGLAGLALAVALGLTLFRSGGVPGGLWRLRTCAVTDPVLMSGDGLANLALFAPAAFLAVLAIGRPGRVAAGVAATSVVVEVLQALRNVGVCDSSDALLNTLGGLGAALIAALLRAGFLRLRPLVVPGSDPCPRSC